jgi:hypothetical protein
MLQPPGLQFCDDMVMRSGFFHIDDGFQWTAFFFGTGLMCFGVNRVECLVDIGEKRSMPIFLIMPVRNY